MYREAGFEISTDIATMMLACIMSDSLLWKSPTTTQEDKDIADALQKISKIHDLEKFAMPMFEAKSDL
jgi:manganese-dependent inorganic pyrophosphatase